jgi:ABC-type Fe3+/spermidine/putrescine transport system ATPase subunit
MRVRDELLDDIRRVHAEYGTTLLVLTCEPREAMALADRVAVMDLGKIVQAGDPCLIYNRPADAFVAHFLGPTNLFQGQVESHDARGEVIVRTPLGRLVGKTNSSPNGVSVAPLNGIEPLPAGTPVTVTIRPEALSVGGVVPPDSNRFPATVERLVFLGQVRLIHLRGPNEWPVIAAALQSGSESLREGQSLTASVQPDRVVVLPGRYAMPH